jgi:hypothetical protein
MISVKRMRGLMAALLLPFTAAIVIWASMPAAASAASPAWWKLVSHAEPVNIEPGGEGEVVDQAINIGTASTEGEETVTDVLPPGFHVVENEEGAPEVSFFVFSFVEGKQDIGPASPFSGFESCHVNGRTVTCTTFAIGEELNLGPVKPYEYLEMRVRVQAGAEAAPSSPNTLEISGGGAPEASVTHPLLVNDTAPSFGIDNFSMTPESPGGRVDVQAGSHPLQLTSTLSLNQTSDSANPPDLLRSLHFELPAGFVGNVGSIPQCSNLDFQHVVSGGTPNLCPSDTVVGAAVVTLNEPRNFGLITFPVPVFNLEPTHGEPARFGFELTKSPVILDTSVRSGRDYGVDVDVTEVTQLASLVSSTVTIWGAPTDPIHDPSRGWGCLAGGYWTTQSHAPCIPSLASHPAPFLTLPTSCEAPFAPTVEGRSWPTATSPEGVPAPRKTYQLADSFGRALGIVGCDQLPFAPSIAVKPELSSASSPSGLDVRVTMPQETNENSSGLEDSAIRSTTVTLPDGLGVNPAAAAGLEACSEGEFGFEGEAQGTLQFAPSIGSPFCPDAAKIGTVRLRTPILPGALEGSVYLAAQTANPFGSLIAMYVLAENPTNGVRIKLAGEVSLSEDGQITTTLRNTPQAPIEEADFSFFGGPHASLATPSGCGSYETRAVFTPWSGNAPVDASSTFAITAGPHGTGCSHPRRFSPGLRAGTENTRAGGFAPLVTSISREDGDQNINGVELHLPAGLAGMIASVEPCGEAQANLGTCSPQSLLGHSTAQVGVGSEPYELGGGQVFLTGPYRGAPFGLSIVTPAKAGPFDLGNVIVRARLEVDRRTAAVTVATDQSGPYAIPTHLKGIPVDLKRIVVTVDRQGFTFNPTNCQSLATTGTITGDEGARAAVSAPFQAANCANLRFNPKFTVSTSARTSKAKGAGLVTKVVYPKTAQGTEANITKVKVSLPKQLPSRLTTLQKACLAAVFAANPANCPAGSVIGHARVKTPVLPVPLTGPAYFVSHGNEAFPSLTIVLQGDNVTVELIGATLIRNGITSTTFNTVPDVPFSEFELTLPQGPFSALAANGNLCQGSLLMPTEFFGQNGAVLKRSTKIAVTGCKKKSLTRKQKLAKALKACHKKRGTKRANCERAARRRFGPVKKKGRGGKK